MGEFDSAQYVLDTLLVAKQQYMEKEEFSISISSVDGVPYLT